MLDSVQNPFADISINQIEYGITVGDQPYNSNTFRVKFPKLMVRTVKDKIVFNKSIFVNAPSCSILSKNTLNTLDYITVKKSPLCNLSPLRDSKGNIPDNTIVVCRSINGDIKDMVIVDME